MAKLWDQRWLLLSALPFVSLGAALLFAFVDFVLAAVVGVFGVFVLTPLLALSLAFWPLSADESEEVADSAETLGTTSTKGDDVEALQERYTQGKIDEAEFEQAVEDALSTDSTDTDAESAELERE